MSTLESKYHFGGIRFEFPEDFIKELRPTKWSIRKFISIKNSLDIIERSRFVEHVLHTLPEFFNDKETTLFIQAIKERIYNLPDKNHTPVRVDTENQNELIKVFAVMKKNGIIKASATTLAILLKNQFGVKYSLSTIRDKIYNCISE